MEARQLDLTLRSTSKDRPLSLTIDRLIVAGWVGKNKDALARHIEELGKLGVPAPSRTPTYMNLSPAALTTSNEMAVVGPESSGEVECILIKSGSKIYVGVGSDHTDRAFEKQDIPASKQMCTKPIAPIVWDMQEIKGHLDELMMRSWVKKNGVSRLYQENSLSANIPLMQILEGIPREDNLGLERFCIFCGTFPAIGGIEVGEAFEFEIHDPVLERKIRHFYTITCLPQYL
jgi:hypothetical protein